jgi:hypothetical protein
MSEQRVSIELLQAVLDWSVRVECGAIFRRAGAQVVSLHEIVSDLLAVRAEIVQYEARLSNVVAALDNTERELEEARKAVYWLVSNPVENTTAMPQWVVEQFKAGRELARRALDAGEVKE